MWRASVSNIECFRQWESDEDLDLGWLLQRILGPDVPTENMKAGIAFHKAMELLSNNAAEELAADGYRFHIDCDVELVDPAVKEMSVVGNYRNLVVSGRVDGVLGKTVIDHKTTMQFDPDRLLSGFQWRYYLDITGLDRFVWNVFVMREVDLKTYAITDFHSLEQRRYPELHVDCERLAAKYALFAAQYLAAKRIIPSRELEITDEDIALKG